MKKRKIIIIRNDNGKNDIRKNVNIDDLANSCFNEYTLNIKDGLSETESFKKVIKSLIEDFGSKTNENNNQYKFIFIVSGIAFVACLILHLIGLFVGDVLDVYGVLYPICLLFSIGLMIYLISTHKKRRLLDYLVCIFIFLGSLFINFEAISYFYRARTGNFYYSLYYKFPGILIYDTHSLISQDPITFEITNTKYLFDPTLIIAFICFTITTILYIIDKRRKHVNNFVNY